MGKDRASFCPLEGGLESQQRASAQRPWLLRGDLVGGRDTLVANLDLDLLLEVVLHKEQVRVKHLVIAEIFLHAHAELVNLHAVDRDRDNFLYFHQTSHKLQSVVNFQDNPIDVQF